jgi:hypothetical protein
MTEANFQGMSRQELLQYITEHREDREAFYAYMDKLNTEPVLATLPASESIDDSEVVRTIEKVLQIKAGKPKINQLSDQTSESP